MSNLDVDHIWDSLLKKENRETTLKYKDICSEPRSKMSFFSITSLQHSKKEDIFGFGDVLVGIRLGKNETKPCTCELRINGHSFSRLVLQPGQSHLPLDGVTVIPLISLYDKHPLIKLEHEADLEFVYAILSYEQILTFRENGNKFYYKRDNSYSIAIEDNNIHLSTRDYKAKNYIKLHTEEPLTCFISNNI